MSEAVPKEIDRYDVVRLLGAGGMGAVYEARHKVTGRRVAVKLIKPEAVAAPGVVERFQREARAAGAIASEFITQVLDSGTDPATEAPFLVMELLAGEDLHAVAKRLKPMRPDLALRIVAQALMGLERAHNAQVVHRDIKPPNLFLAQREDETYVVKLCDFGIAKVGGDLLTSSQNHALTQTSALLGSPSYMSPEQAKGSKTTDARTDLWSMGVVLYELLVGGTPYPDADTLGLVLLAICSNPQPNVQELAPWVPADVEAIVRRAMTTELSRRYQTARDMLDAVLALLPNGTSIDASMLTPMTDDEFGQVAPKSVNIDVASLAATLANTGEVSGSGANAISQPGADASLAATRGPRRRSPPVEEGPPASESPKSDVDPYTATAGAYARGSEQPPAAPRSGRSRLVAGAIGAAAALAGFAFYLGRTPPPTAPAGLSQAPPASESIAPVPLAPPNASITAEPQPPAMTTSLVASASASAKVTNAPSRPAPGPSAKSSSPYPAPHASVPPATPKAASPAVTSTSSPISRDFN